MLLLYYPLSYGAGPNISISVTPRNHFQGFSGVFYGFDLYLWMQITQLTQGRKAALYRYILAVEVCDILDAGCFLPGNDDFKYSIKWCGEQ